MGFGIDILAPANITRVMKATRDKQTLPMPLKWYPRAAKPQASDDEMTMKEQTQIYAADIISADSEALVREAGKFSFVQHGSNKLKHGYSLTESMIRTYRRIESGMAMDNEIGHFSGWIADKNAKLVLGIEQRVEGMINGMLADGYDYNRFGIQVSGSWGMPSDLKFTPVVSWNDPSSTPITDVINALVHAYDKYGEAYNRITISYEILSAWVATTEFKNIYKENALKYETSTNATANARSASPAFYLPFLSAFIGDSLATDSQAGGREVVIEVDRGTYYEYSPSTVGGRNERFHPSNLVFFTNSGDDNGSGWDVGNGEVIEALLGSLGGTNVIGGSFTGLDSFYGPVGYATQANGNLNPAGLVCWAAAWMAPRKHRDTCTAMLTAWE